MIPYQEITVDLLPASVPPRIRLNASQYDNGRPIRVTLQYASEAYTLPQGATAYVDVRKPSGKIVHDAATVTAGSSVVTFDLTTQMTAEYGQVLMELSLVGDDQDPIGTANWIMLVEMSPLHAGDPSETWVRDIDDAIADAQGYASAAQQSADDSEDSAEDAEAWAVGQRDGTDVPDTDPTYHNNSKYWSEVSEQSGEAQAENAEAWAVGQRSGVDVPSSDETYHNNSKYYSEEADRLGQEQAQNAEAWANGERGGVDVPDTDPAYHNNAQYWSEISQQLGEQQAENAEAWAVGQRSGVDVPDTDPTYHNSAKYWAEFSAESGGFAFFDIDDSTGEMMVTVSGELSQDVTFSINENSGELEVTVV